MQTEQRNIRVDDLSLVERWRQGDPAALEGLIIKYQDRIFNTILKICGNRDDAAELTQDAFVKVLENISDFKGLSSFYTWLFRVAVNLTLNYCKRRGRFAARSLDLEISGDEEGKGRLRMLLADEAAPNPAEVAENKELCELLHNALAKLDDSQRAVIVLRDIEGMQYAEIAETLHLELGTVKSRLSRARSNLREILETVLK